MSGIWQDIRYAMRGFARARGVTLVSVLTIGLGIGATAVIFSLVDALLLRPLPVEEMDRLVWVQELIESREGRAPSARRVFQYNRFTALRGGAAAAGVELAAFGVGEVAFRGDGDAEGLLGLFATGNYFDVLGVRPARGRFFNSAEERPGATAPVAVISDHLWQTRFGGDPGVIGRTVFINSQPVTVIGVTPPKFGGAFVGLEHDVWIPLSHYNQLNPGSEINAPGAMYWLDAFGRLGAGVEAGQMEAQLGAIARALPPEQPNTPAAAGVRLHRFTGLPTDARGPVTGFVLMLQFAAALVLLIASINVGGVLLARAAARRHEIAVRLAVGAGRGRLLRQLLTESIALFVLGGGAGLLMAAWGTKLLRALEPPVGVRVSLDLGLDHRVIIVALGVALVTGLIFGLAPALEAVRPGSAAVLKAGGRSGPGGEGRPTRLRNIFVAAQIAFSLLLLCTAGLFTRALQRSLAEETGFEPDGVVVASFDTRGHDYDEPQTRQFYGALLARVAALPGVASASLAGHLPMPGTSYGGTDVEIVGPSAAAWDEGFGIESNTVDVGYFETLRIPQLAGRVFEPADRAGAPMVAVINETFAQRFWPGENAVGRAFRAPRAHPGAEIEVVGVVRDTQDQTSGGEPRPYFYLPFAQSYSMNMTIVARLSHASVGEVLAGIRNVARELDPNLPLHRAGSYAAQYRISLLPQRLAASALGAFGVVGLLMAALGIYGVLSFQVGQRTPEIGIRLALGARAGEVVGLVLRQGMTMIVVGLAVGLGLALAGARLIAGFLHGVDPGDLLTFVGVPVVLLAVALLASWVPARRAARVDPMVALRVE